MSKKPHLTFQDRLLIKRHVDLGVPTKAIAHYLGKASNTISEEISKNGGDQYDPNKAQERADRAKIETAKGRKRPLQELIARVDELERKIETLMGKRRIK